MRAQCYATTMGRHLSRTRNWYFRIGNGGTQVAFRTIGPKSAGGLLRKLTCSAEICAIGSRIWLFPRKYAGSPMYRLPKFALGMLVCLLIAPTRSDAHSGGTNANGCHTNRKTGDYHCHKPKAPSPNRQAYCHALNGEYRCGYAKSTCNDLVDKFGGRCVKE